MKCYSAAVTAVTFASVCMSALQSAGLLKNIVVNDIIFVKALEWHRHWEKKQSIRFWRSTGCQQSD